MANTQVQLGQKLQLTIKRLGINGEGIGYYKKLIIFVPRVLPGEQVIAEVTKASPRFAEAKMTKI
ncbi:TRAM domain-containing protein, partial [Enterococcus faecium]